MFAVFKLFYLKPKPTVTCTSSFTRVHLVFFIVLSLRLTRSGVLGLPHELVWSSSYHSTHPYIKLFTTHLTRKIRIKDLLLQKHTIMANPRIGRYDDMIINKSNLIIKKKKPLYPTNFIIRELLTKKAWRQNPKISNFHQYHLYH